jgi:hypothetical protein
MWNLLFAEKSFTVSSYPSICDTFVTFFTIQNVDEIIVNNPTPQAVGGQGSSRTSH